MLPRADIIIIGGGAVGLGVAFALARAGQKDILLLERADDVGQMTTAQGAGLCGQARDTVERIKLAMHSVTVFRELQKTDVTPDWHEVGSLRVALSQRRVVEFQAIQQAADSAGLETALIDNKEAARRWPLMDFTPVKAVLWCPTDGWMTPHRVAQSYANACRKLGVRIVTGAAVQAIPVKNGRVTGVNTNLGSAECRCVINAAGAHAYHIAQLAGLEFPIVPVRHEYFVTVPMAGITPDLPCFRIPELTLYGRVRDGGLLLGGWERESMHIDPRAFGWKETPPPLTPDWKVLDGFGHSLAALLPTAQTAGKQTVGKGWPTFTPDGRFIIGESRRVQGFVMAGGCNAHGISGSGGIGRLLVESLLDPKPSDYVRSLSPDRFSETPWTWDSARAQAARVYETYYGV